MCLASSAMWICMIRASSGWWPPGPPSERSTLFCTWSIGSSPARTPTKKPYGASRAASGRIGASALKTRGAPATSTPERFTNSWNIWVWWHSSVASWVT